MYVRSHVAGGFRRRLTPKHVYILHRVRQDKLTRDLAERIFELEAFIPEVENQVFGLPTLAAGIWDMGP